MKMIFDLIITNGKIYSLEKEDQYFPAMGIKDGHIAKIFLENPPDPNSMAKKWIDLKGKTVLPGLIDSHVHFMVTAAMKELSFNVSE